MSAGPQVTAVVLNWCNASDTLACVASLRAQDVPVGILLVDNASPDGSGAVIAAACPDLPFIQTGANLGYAGGNNAGIRRALESGADWVLVVNDDTVADPAMVRELLAAAARHPAAGALAPWIGLHAQPARAWFAGGHFDPVRAMGVHDEFTGERACTFLSGCCLLLSRALLTRVGAFDERFGSYVEDAEFCLRAARAGFELWYAPRARLLHKASPVNAEPAAGQIRLRDRNRRRLAALHFSPMERLRFAAWFYPTRALHLARYVARGDGARARAILAGAFGG